MIENFEDQYISDTYGLVVQYESGSFYDGFGNFIQTTGSGGSTINTGSFATTGSNTFIGNQTITGSLTLSSSAAIELNVIGGQRILGSLTVTGSDQPLVVSIPNIFSGQQSPTALTLRNESSSPQSGVPGTSIEFWTYNTEENSPSGIYKNGYIINDSYYSRGITFGNGSGTFKFNSYANLGYEYTGSVVTGSFPKPIGNTLFEINNSQVSSSIPVLAPSFIGNLTGTASFATTASFALNTNTGSFATTGSNTFIGNQTITGSLTVTQPITGSLFGTASYASNADLLDGLNSTVFATTGSNTFRGNQTITGSLTISSSNEPLTIQNPTAGPSSPTAINLKSTYSGSSIEFWNFDNEDNQPSGIFKSGYISANPYFADASLTFGTKYSFNFKFFGPYDYTGSITSGINPIGDSVLKIGYSPNYGDNAMSSSYAIVAPSLTLAAGGNLTMGTNGVLIAPAVFNTRTSTYTLQLSDNGKTIEMNSGSANNLIVPTYASVGFPIGTTINGIQLGIGQTTVSGSTGVIIRSAGGRTKTSLQYSGFSLVNRATNEWLLVGDLTT